MTTFHPDFTGLHYVCPTTGCHHELRAMVSLNPANRARHLVECPHCGRHSTVDFKDEGRTPYVVEDPKTTFWNEPIELAEDENQTTDVDDDHSSTPFSVFERAHRDLEKLATVVVNRSVDQLMIRVIFQQFITLMETFLADTFVHICERDDRMVRQIILKVDHYKDEKVSLRAVAGNGDLLRDKVMPWIRGLSWHNMGLADKLSMAVFGESIFPDVHIKEQIVRAVEVRHDLVHRNGRMKNSDDSHRLDSDDIYEVALAVGSLVRHVDRLYMQWLPTFWFERIPDDGFDGLDFPDMSED